MSGCQSQRQRPNTRVFTTTGREVPPVVSLHLPVFPACSICLSLDCSAFPSQGGSYTALEMASAVLGVTLGPGDVAPWAAVAAALPHAWPQSVPAGHTLLVQGSCWILAASQSSYETSATRGLKPSCGHGEWRGEDTGMEAVQERCRSGEEAK